MRGGDDRPKKEEIFWKESKRCRLTGFRYMNGNLG